MAKYQTTRKAVILDFLRSEHSESVFEKFDAPPYSAVSIARALYGTPGEYGDLEVSEPVLQSVARTLRSMAKDDLLVSVRAKQYVRHEVAGRCIKITLTRYHATGMVERDTAIADEWEAIMAARVKKANEGAWIIDGVVVA